MGLFEKIKRISSTPNVDDEAMPETGVVDIEGFAPGIFASPIGDGIGVNIVEEPAGIAPEISELIDGVQNGTVDISSLTQKLAEQAGISLSGEVHSGYVVKEGWEDNYNKNYSGSGEVIPGIRVSGEISQEANVFAGAYSKGDSEIKWNSDQASIRASTQSMIGVEATERTSYKGNLDIEGIDRNLGVDANSQTRVFAGSKVSAETDIVISKDNIHGDLGAKAFAGIEIEKKLDGSLSVDGDSFARAETYGGLKAGIGAELNADVGYRDGQINFGMDLGATLGIGASGGFKGSVDAPGILTHPEAVLESVIETPGIISHPQAVAESAVSAVENLGDSIADVFSW
jgi:hypothetical protein